MSYGVKRWLRRVMGIGVLGLLAGAPLLRAAEPQPLTLSEVVALATARDTEFDAILIDELDIHYQRKLGLPARDLVLGVKQEYVSLIDESRDEGATQVSLAKLFPMTGTEIGAVYETRPSAGADEEQPSRVQFSLAQPIARNAFGRSTRLLDQLIGLEMDVARHQVVEAYEDYLATVMVAYLGWWAAYEELQIGVASYRENQRLLENILEREQQQIAKPIDVNKTRIQVLARKERVVELQEAYSNRLHIVERMIRHDAGSELRPALAADAVPSLPEGGFEARFAAVRDASRTFQILDLLESRGRLDLARQSDDLLPSVDLLFALDAEGDDYGMEDSETQVAVGLRLQWPIPDTVDRAEREVARIGLNRAVLESQNTAFRLSTRLKNLDLQIGRERTLYSIAEEKIGLATAVLEDETENYSFGRVTLNDYIQAVNTLDNNRYSRLRSDFREKVLVIEWLRLTDQLISREAITDRQE